MKKHSFHLYPHTKILHHIVYGLLFSFLLSAIMLPSNASAHPTDTISVGLYFVKNALQSANLQNVSGFGNGYEFGIYEEDASGDRKDFISLAETDVADISMLIDRTMYLSGNEYTSAAQSSITVGAYHLELAYPYDSYREARDVAALYDGGFVAYSYGAYYVRFGSYVSYSDALSESSYYGDCTVTGESEYGITVVRTSTGEILFELDEGAGTTLGVVPIGNGETRTWFKGTQYNGAFRYDRPEGGAMHVANIVPLEQYVAAVLCREFGISWPDEVMKAGACCIRTFARTSTQHSTFDVCNSTCCQVYRGVYQGSQWEYIEQLCEDTAGKCIYYNGAPILAVYHSSNGGATSSSADTWAMDYPYLQGVYDPFESVVSTGAKDWSVTYSLQELTELAQAWGFNCGTISEVFVSERSEQGNVNAVTFKDINGNTHTFTGDDTMMFGNSLYSRRYVIIPPWGSAELTEVAMNGSDGTASGNVSEAGNSTLLDGEFLVYDGTSTTTLNTITVLTANGTSTVSGTIDVLYGDGQSETSGGQPINKESYPSAELNTRTIINETNEYMVYGSGWGHNVGLSAYGAYAMAQLGYNYMQILQFYYQGVTIQ